MKNADKITSFIDGARIYLRGVELNDVNDTYHRWLNDHEVTKYLESRFFPNSMDSLRKYIEDKLNDRENVFLAIIIRKGNRHIGNIKLGPINWVHRYADVALIIGEKDCWRKGYGTEAINLIADYAFEKLALHKLTAGCYDINQGSSKSFQKANFTIEGVCKSHYFYNGKYVDRVILGRWNEKKE